MTVINMLGRSSLLKEFEKTFDTTEHNARNGFPCQIDLLDDGNSFVEPQRSSIVLSAVFQRDYAINAYAIKELLIYKACVARGDFCLPFC